MSGAIRIQPELALPVIAALIALCALAGVWLLWRLAGWASQRARQAAWLWACVAVIVACAALVGYGLFFGRPPGDGIGRSVRAVLANVAMLLPLCLPAAFTIGLAQVLVLNRVSARASQIAGFCCGLAGLVLVPFVALIGGCGLAGACL